LLLTGGSRGCRQWAGKNNALKKFLSMSPITASISKHSLTKLYLYILRRKALITSFCIFIKKPPQAHRAYRILDKISAWNTVSKCIEGMPWSRSKTRESAFCGLAMLIITCSICRNSQSTLCLRLNVVKYTGSDMRLKSNDLCSSRTSMARYRRTEVY